MKYTVFYKLDGSLIFSRDFSCLDTARTFANLKYKDAQVREVSLKEVTEHGYHTIKKVEKGSGDAWKPGKIVRRGLNYNHATAEIVAARLPVVDLRSSENGKRTGFYDCFGQCLAVYDALKETLVFYDQKIKVPVQEIIDLLADRYDNHGFSRGDIRQWLEELLEYGYAQNCTVNDLDRLFDLICG